jgi:hypothetical protein
MKVYELSVNYISLNCPSHFPVCRRTRDTTPLPSLLGEM